MEIVDQNVYRDDLLKWCNNIYLYWENMEPRFSKLFDLKSLDEWEDSCRKLMEKLQTDLEVNLEDYNEATRLYEKWEVLFKESDDYQENIESEERKIETMSFDFDNEKAEPTKANNKIDELNNERIELIKMALNLEIPIQQIRKFLLDHKG
jgi:uncharacterized coiled-coil DUF342 family protein